MLSFYILAIVTVIAAVMVVTRRNPMYSALWLFVMLFSLAGIYLLLNAEFVAAIQVLIYAGGVLILYVFVIMLVDLSKEAAPRRTFQKPLQIAAALAMATLVGAVVIWITMGGMESFSFEEATTTAGAVDTTRAFAQELFLTYFYPFEIASILLLVAMIGSVVLARRLAPATEPEEERES